MKSSVECRPAQPIDSMFRVKAGVFPVRLASEDWASGDTVWLLDVIAGDRKAATAVLANFRQVSEERAVKIHPLVGG